MNAKQESADLRPSDWLHVKTNAATVVDWFQALNLTVWREEWSLTISTQRTITNRSDLSSAIYTAQKLHSASNGGRLCAYEA